MARGSRCSYALAICPECVQHVRYCAKHEEVSCPFCSHAFVPEAVDGSAPTARAVRPRSSRGVLAASFVGATLIAATSVGCPMVAEYGMPYPDGEWEEEVDGDVGMDAGETGDGAEEGTTDQEETGGDE